MSNEKSNENTSAIAIAEPTPAWAEASVTWSSAFLTARIGECSAEIRMEVPKALPAYFTWRVTRDTTLAMSGSARTIGEAKDACMRAAKVLMLDGWPSAFAHEGILR